VPVHLQITRRQRNNNDRTLEQLPILAQLILLALLGLLFSPVPCPFAIYARRLISNRSALDAFGPELYVPVVQARRLRGRAAEDANVIYALEASNLLCRFEARHDGQLNVHEHQMETAGSPLSHGFPPIDGTLPAHFETPNELHQ